MITYELDRDKMVRVFFKPILDDIDDLDEARQHLIGRLYAYRNAKWNPDESFSVRLGDIIGFRGLPIEAPYYVTKLVFEDADLKLFEPEDKHENKETPEASQESS